MTKLLRYFLIVFLCVSVAGTCKSQNIARLNLVAKACAEATGGHINTGEHRFKDDSSRIDYIEILLPDSTNCYNFVSAITPVMQSIIADNYLWRQPWKVVTNYGHMMSISQLVEPVDMGLFMIYSLPTKTLSICEAKYSDVGFGNIINSPEVPVLSNPTLYSTICGTAYDTAGFIKSDEIENVSDSQQKVITNIQLQKDTNIETLTEQLASLHFLLLLTEHMELSQNWSLHTDELGLSLDLWSCEYSASESNHKYGQYHISKITIWYEAKTQNLQIQFLRNKNI